MTTRTDKEQTMTTTHRRPPAQVFDDYLNTLTPTDAHTVLWLLKWAIYVALIAAGAYAIFVPDTTEWVFGT